MEVIHCQHSYTIYDSNGYSVVEYTAIGNETGKIAPYKLTAVGSCLPTNKDLIAILQGAWKDDKRGRQFHVESFEIALPTSEDGVIAYLSSLKSGIGKAIAQRIYRKFAENTWEVLDNRPELLLSVPGISPKKLKVLKEKISETTVVRELLNLFKGSPDITPKKAMKISTIYGSNAVKAITADPYCLCNLSGFGFATVDKLAKSLGADPHNPNRMEGALQCVFGQAAARGSLCLAKDELLNGLYNTTNEGFPAEVCSREFCDSAIVDSINNKLSFCSGTMFYSRKNYFEERITAREVVRLLKHQGEQLDVSAELAEYEKESDIELAAQQRDGVLESFKSQLSIITGGPGTGKTTIIKAILAVQEAISPESKVILVAPTGRAARRMSEATGHEASTIHSAIGYMGVSDDEESEEVFDGVMDPDEKLDADTVIVDEVSMLDQHVASILFHKISNSTRLILVGDPDQLPSVGAGNVLFELIRSNEAPVTTLEVIFRQGQDSPIISNADAIKHGICDLTWARTFKMIEAYREDDIFDKAVDMYVRSVKAYGIDNVVLLNPYKKQTTRLAVPVFNATIQNIINPVKPGQLTLKCGNTEFRVGDKVMQTRNTDMAKNGDVGYITEIQKSYDAEDSSSFQLVCIIEFNGDGIKSEYTLEDMMSIVLAYCSTVHKSQGSEYQTVILTMSHLHEYALRRNLVYTAITRATTNVAIIGEPETLQKAILNNKTDVRNTLLADRIHQSMALAA